VAPLLLAIAVSSRQLLPKADTSVSDCEDSISMDVPHLRFAVADGATEAFDSRRWARYLTRAWASHSSRALEDYGYVERVRPLGERLEKKWSGRRLPWYLEEKAAGGSFAAFLGLQLTPDGQWSAVALGDVCLILERDRVVETSFPLSSADDFSTRPVLLASKTDTDATRQALRLSRGVCLGGDVLLLMSDAIACWYLGHATSSRDLLDEFHIALADSSAFATFVDRERMSRRLKNDDVAVLKLVLSDVHGS
jgi:hypothetical protein